MRRLVGLPHRRVDAGLRRERRGRGISVLRAVMFSALAAAMFTGCAAPSVPRAVACPATASAGTVYVDSSAGSDADAGTADAPVATINHALTMSRTVALAPGTYRETLSLRDPASITARCGGHVVLDGADGGEAEAVVSMALDGDVLLDGLTITGGRLHGVMVTRGTVTLHNVDVVGNRGAGLRVSGSTAIAIAEASIFRENTPAVESEPLAFGQGIYGDRFGTIAANGITVRENTGLGIFLIAGALDLTDSRVEGTLSNADGTYGDGIHVEDGAAVTLRDSLLVNNRNVGLYATQPRTVVTMEDTTILGTLPSDAGLNGHGMSAWTGAQIVASGVTIAETEGAGVCAQSAGSTIEFSNGTIRDTRADTDGLNGFAVSVFDGGRVAVADSRLLRNSAGAQAYGVGAVVAIDRSTVAWPDPPPDVDRGSGLTAGAGGALTLTDSSVTDQAEVGVLARGVGSVATVTGSTIADTHVRPGQRFGLGAVAQDGASLVITGSLLTRNHVAAVLAKDAGTTLTVTDSALVHTLAQPDGKFGRGMELQTGATASITRTRIQYNRDVGVFSHGARVDMVDSLIADTQVNGALGAGRGFVADSGTTLHMKRCSILRNHEIGIVAISFDALVTLDDVTVTGTTTGAYLASAFGIVAKSHASIVANGLTVSDTEGPGLIAVDFASVVCRRCLITRNGRAGVIIQTAEGDVSASTISANGVAAEGVGVYVGEQGPLGRFTLRDNVIEGHAEAAIWISGPGLYDIEGNTLSGAVGVPIRDDLNVHGNGVYADGGDWGEASQLVLADNRFAENVGVSVFLDGASAALDGNRFEDAGLGVLQQRCGSVAPPTGLAAVPSSDICPAADALALSFLFSFYMAEAEAVEE